MPTVYWIIFDLERERVKTYIVTQLLNSVLHLGSMCSILLFVPNTGTGTVLCFI